MNHSKMYKKSGIHIDSSWHKNINNSTDDIVNELTSTAYTTDDSYDNEPANDPFCEIQNDGAIEGNADTLLEDADLNTNETYVSAPGENRMLLSMFHNEYFEYLCFPNIFVDRKHQTMKIEGFQ